MLITINAYITGKEGIMIRAPHANVPKLAKTNFTKQNLQPIINYWQQNAFISEHTTGQNS